VLDCVRAMNIHHLELFYYVAKHGGISAAVRHMPYGIQQPAVSSQILLLEEDLGVKLFERQPFKLTPTGVELLAFVQPFFDNLEPVAMKLRQGSAPQLRIGAPEAILRDHLPSVIQRVKQKHPELRLSVRSGLQLQLESWVRDREIDVAVLPLSRRLPKPLRSLLLLRLPLVLLVPKKSKRKSAAEFWAAGRPAEPLISLPESDALSLLFASGLKRLNVTWPVAVEASSLVVTLQYVANGDGVGVSIGVPDLVQHPQVRVLPLEGFGRLELMAVWQGEPTPVLQALLDEMQRYAAHFFPMEPAADG
jgi:DNA-binding transcriptional LysR family regulator